MKHTNPGGYIFCYEGTHPIDTIKASVIVEGASDAVILRPTGDPETNYVMMENLSWLKNVRVKDKLSYDNPFTSWDSGHDHERYIGLTCNYSGTSQYAESFTFNIQDRFQFLYANPPHEQRTVTNDNNAVMLNVLARPATCPAPSNPGEYGGAWNAITAEIVGGNHPDMVGFLVAGYFAARTDHTKARIWGLNPLISLTADADMACDGICVEIDLNNELADGKGQGLTIEGTGVHNPNHAIWVKRAQGLWEYGLRFDQIKYMGIDFRGAYQYAPIGWTPAADTNDPFIYAANALGTKTLFELRKGTITLNRPAGGYSEPFIWLLNNDTEVFKIGNTGQVILEATSDPLYWKPTDDDNDVFCYVPNIAATKTLLEIRKGTIRINQLDAWTDEFILLRHNDTDIFSLWSDGSIYFQTDVQLHRGAANVLETPDQFKALDGLVTKSKAGTISDADFVVPTVGLLAIDTTNKRIYFRTGSAAWSYVASSIDDPFISGTHLPKATLTHDLGSIDFRWNYIFTHGLFATSGVNAAFYDLGKSQIVAADGSVRASYLKIGGVTVIESDRVLHYVTANAAILTAGTLLRERLDGMSGTVSNPTSITIDHGLVTACS
jgi:hypothetical protein